MIITDIENKHITDVKINDGIVANKIAVGSFVKNTAEVQIINLNHAYDNLLGKEINIQGFGTWYVNDLSTDEEFTESKLSLYDITYKFDADYEDSFSFPATMGAWATWIGNKVGVPLKGDFLNSNLVLKERPYLGINPKYRDAVQKIAKYASSYARKNYDNTYSICWFEENLTEIEDWEDFVHGNTTNQTNVIVLSTGDTEDNVIWPEIKPQDPYELRIEDEWTNIERYAINEVIYNQVNGFSYTPISKLNVPYGLLELRAGQKIKTQDMEFQDVDTYISKVTLEWQGGEFEDLNAWTTSLQMEELNETSTKLEYANGKRNRLLNVERLTDKNNGLIQDLIEETSEYEDRITSVEQTAKDIVQKVESKIDFTRNASGIYKVVIEDAQEGPLIGLRIKGEMELLYPSNDLYPSDDLYLLDSYLWIEDEDELKTGWKLPIDHLYKVDDISDEFVIERVYNEETELFEQHMKIIRRIFIDDNGNKFIASNEKVEDLGLININLSKGKNTIWLESFYDVPLSYYVTYAISNDLTKEFATKLEMKSSIEQTENSINLELEKKVDDETLTGANIILRINDDESEATINADKIVLTANDILNLIAGNVINLTSKNIVITSDNFSVDTNGNAILNSATLNSAKIVGGSFDISSENSNLSTFTMSGKIGSEHTGTIEWNPIKMTWKNGKGAIIAFNLALNQPIFSLEGNGGTTTISSTYVNSPSIVQTSLVEQKKNFEKFENALDIIKDIDLYKFNLKNEDDNHKKHIGFVIGKEYNYSSEITAVDEEGKEIGVDNYSMISLCLQCIKEQQNLIEKLNDRIEVLEK